MIIVYLPEIEERLDYSEDQPRDKKGRFSSDPTHVRLSVAEKAHLVSTSRAGGDVGKRATEALAMHKKGFHGEARKHLAEIKKTHPVLEVQSRGPVPVPALQEHAKGSWNGPHGWGAPAHELAKLPDTIPELEALLKHHNAQSDTDEPLISQMHKNAAEAVKDKLYPMRDKEERAVAAKAKEQEAFGSQSNWELVKKSSKAEIEETVKNVSAKKQELEGKIANLNARIEKEHDKDTSASRKAADKLHQKRQEHEGELSAHMKAWGDLHAERGRAPKPAGASTPVPVPALQEHAKGPAAAARPLVDKIPAPTVPLHVAAFAESQKTHGEAVAAKQAAEAALAARTKAEAVMAKAKMSLKAAQDWSTDKSEYGQEMAKAVPELAKAHAEAQKAHKEATATHATAAADASAKLAGAVKAKEAAKSALGALPEHEQRAFLESHGAPKAAAPAPKAVPKPAPATFAPAPKTWFNPKKSYESGSEEAEDASFHGGSYYHGSPGRR